LIKFIDYGSELIFESREGAERIAQIVRNLRDFLNVETHECHLIDLNQSLDLSLSYLMHEFYDLRPPRKKFGEISPTRCHWHQLN